MQNASTMLQGEPYHNKIRGIIILQPLSNINIMRTLTELPEWQDLIAHHREIAPQHMRDWFSHDRSRSNRLTLICHEIMLDYSRNRIQAKTLDLLIKLTHAIGLPKKIEALFSGACINTTEKRAALHTALRDPHMTPVWINGHNAAEEISAVRIKMQNFVDKVHQQSARGITGKPIAHIVNIGIGGSYIGPMMCAHALKDFAHHGLQLHFISTVDALPLREVLARIDPETTLFIISSKSFSTIETLTNARTVVKWMQSQLGPDVFAQHFVAVTAQVAKAIDFGVPRENIFELWDFVGGRYSIWSAIGLPLMLMIGKSHFADFLNGAYEMDQHFRTAPYSQNMPVLMALLSIWYTNFFGAKAQAIIPYAHRLRELIPYLQQVEMESNGKRINLNGETLTYSTSPIIFGEEGCRGQHAYHQLLHQGQHFIPVDFILTGECALEDDIHQHILFASALSQAQALMQGKTYDEAYAELTKQYTAEEARALAHHLMIPGNRPSNILFINRITPKNLGALIALYEHKIFVQGVIWEINSFDQWGVELGKQLLPKILNKIQVLNSEHPDAEIDYLIQHFWRLQQDES